MDVRLSKKKVPKERSAPKLIFSSLDFERVVNSYSISATRARLSVQDRNRTSHQRDVLSFNKNNNETRPILPLKSPHSTYEAFERSFHTPDSLILTQTKSSRSPDSSPSTNEKHYLGKKRLLGYSGRTAIRWALTFLVGLLTGCVAVLITNATDHVVRFRESGLNRLEQSIFLGDLQQDSSSSAEIGHNRTSIEVKPVLEWWEPNPATDLLAQKLGFSGVFMTYASFNLILALLSATMCLKFAPEAIGSGIPEVKAYLNGVRVKKFSSWKCLIVKIIGTILSVSSGLCIGPEGPLVHVGAIIGAGLTKTSWLEEMVRGAREHFPCASRLVGCAPTMDEADDRYNKKADDGNIFGEEEESGSSSANDSWMASSDEKKQTRQAKPLRCWYQSSFLSSIVFQLSHFRNDAERRDLISIGAAAGFAAAFGAPVGGVLFSLEEASTFFANQMLWKSLLATAIATFCIAVFSGNLTNFSVISLGDISTPNDMVLHRRLEEVPFYVIMGVGGGTLGALFNAVWKSMNKRRKIIYLRYTSDKKRNCDLYKLMEVAIVSLVTSFLSFTLPLISNWACQPVVKGVVANTMIAHDDVVTASADDNNDDIGGDFSEGFAHQFNCAAGETNELASILFGSREEAISNILTDPTSFEQQCLLSVGLLFFILMIITYGVALPSGIFMPTVLAGSALGGFVGVIFQQNILPSIEPSLFALLGATALLAGIQRNTVSLCVILMEGTGQTKFLIPIIVTIIVARYVGDLFSHGVYEIGMELKGYPFLEHIDHHSLDMYSVADVMSYPAVTLKVSETAGTIEKILNNVNHHAFPVVDEKQHLLGIVRRDQLVALLECGIYVETAAWNKGSRSGSVFSHNHSPSDGATSIFSDSASDRSRLDDLVPDDLRFSFFKDDDSSAELSCAMMGAEDLSRSSYVDRDNSGFTRHIRRDSTLMNMALFIRDDRYTSLDNMETVAIDDPIGGEGDEWLRDNVRILPDNTIILGTDESLPIGSKFNEKKTVVKKGSDGRLLVSLNPADYDKHVDIDAVMNRACHCVLENCPLSTAFKKFSVLGLRHLCVIGSKGKIVGIVTRSNLISEYIVKNTQ